MKLTLCGVGMLFVGGLTAIAQTTINPSNRDAFGANIGWINWESDVTNGAVIGEFVCSGYLYSANVGWIHLGSGDPDNGVQYSNAVGNDYGVNHDSAGALRGYAYGANIGWINFENTGNPRVNLQTGLLSGYVWGANVGWISLSNSFAVVKTDSITGGLDTDGDSIPDAWELSHTGDLTTLGGRGDFDGDGRSDVAEYLADTDPLDGDDFLRITSVSHSTSPIVATTLAWRSRPTRNYQVEAADVLTGMTLWSDDWGILAPDSGLTTVRNFLGGNPTNRFYRVQAILPLSN